MQKHGILDKSDASPNLQILYNPLQQMFVREEKLKDARLLMHCTRKLVIKVRCKECGHSRMATISLPLSGNMLQGSAPCHGPQCDTNRYPACVVVTPLIPLLPCSSSSRMRNALRGHDPHSGTALALVISTISKLSQRTDLRLKVS